MNVVVLGAGMLGISTVWHLLQTGYQVTVVELQPDAALKTGFTNAVQILVSYCESWANRDALLKALKWMFSKNAPLLFHMQADPRQWWWRLKFLGQRDYAAFTRNVQQLVALQGYSHEALKALVRATGIDYHRLECGIAHYYTDAKSFDTAGDAAALMRKYGVERRVVRRFCTAAP